MDTVNRHPIDISSVLLLMSFHSIATFVSAATLIYCTLDVRQYADWLMCFCGGTWLYGGVIVLFFLTWVTIYCRWVNVASIDVGPNEIVLRKRLGRDEVISIPSIKYLHQLGWEINGSECIGAGLITIELDDRLILIPSVVPSMASLSRDLQLAHLAHCVALIKQSRQFKFESPGLWLYAEYFEYQRAPLFGVRGKREKVKWTDIETVLAPEGSGHIELTLNASCGRRNLFIWLEKCPNVHLLLHFLKTLR